jgi:hypothetical protein
MAGKMVAMFGQFPVATDIAEAKGRPASRGRNAGLGSLPAVGEPDDGVVDEYERCFGFAPPADGNPQVGCPSGGCGDVLESAAQPSAVGVQDL